MRKAVETFKRPPLCFLFPIGRDNCIITSTAENLIHFKIYYLPLNNWSRQIQFSEILIYPDSSFHSRVYISDWSVSPSMSYPHDTQTGRVRHADSLAAHFLLTFWARRSLWCRELDSFEMSSVWPCYKKEDWKSLCGFAGLACWF